MKKSLSLALILALVLSLCPAALAALDGEYEWRGLSILVTDLDTKPMFAPADMTDDEFAIIVSTTVPAAVFADADLFRVLLLEARLTNGDGAQYRVRASATNEEERSLLLFFAITKGVDTDTLTLDFAPDEAQDGPAESVGDEAVAILTVERVQIPKNNAFRSLTVVDENGQDVEFAADPDLWFENAEFIRIATVDPDGFIGGIYIDEETKEILMIEDGDRINLSFTVGQDEVEFSFGPGAKIAVQKTDGGYLLLPGETVALSPPQLEVIPTAYQVLYE